MCYQHDLTQQNTFYCLEYCCGTCQSPNCCSNRSLAVDQTICKNSYVFSSTIKIYPAIDVDALTSSSSGNSTRLIIFSHIYNEFNLKKYILNRAAATRTPTATRSRPGDASRPIPASAAAHAPIDSAAIQPRTDWINSIANSHFPSQQPSQILLNRKIVLLLVEPKLILYILFVWLQMKATPTFMCCLYLDSCLRWHSCVFLLWSLSTKSQPNRTRHMRAFPI